MGTEKYEILNIDAVALVQIVHFELAVMDTGPNVPSTFVYGNNFWFNSAGLCDLSNAALPISLSTHLPQRMHADLMTSASPFRMEARMIYANYSDSMQVDLQFQLQVSAA